MDLPSPKGSPAFSLIELLVAVAVAAVVVGAALALILHSFDVWGQGVAQAGALRAADDFDVDFSRDFASACPALGFQGTERACVFWSLRPSADDTDLFRVRYAIGDSGVTAEHWTFGDDLEKSGIVTRYPTSCFSTFSYGGTNLADEVWLTTWDCKTNMPQAVLLRSTQQRFPSRRIHLRPTILESRE